MKLCLFVGILLCTGALACYGGSKGGDSGSGSNGGDGAGAGDVGGDNSPGAGNIGTGGSSSNSDPLHDIMGIESGKLVGYDPSEHEGQNGAPVASGEELACGFEDDEQCCWENEGSADQRDWLVGKQEVDEAKFQENFNGALPPKANYLLTGASKASPDESAAFVSCTVGCTDDDVIITLDHWRNKNAKIEVCKRTTGSKDLTDCQLLPEAEQPGPSLVTLPPGKDFEVVVVASNFVGDEVDVAIIDNLAVDFVPCEEDASMTTAAPGGENPPIGECEALQCTFEDDHTCNFNQGEINDPDFQSATIQTFGTDKMGRFGPQSTGPRKASEGDKYAAARLNAGEGAAAVTEMNLSEDRVLGMDYWEATAGLQFLVCLDDNDIDCPLASDTDVALSDWQWKKAKILLPAGTKKVKMIAKNTGNNIGVVGIDNVQLLTVPPSGNPEDADQPAC